MGDSKREKSAGARGAWEPMRLTHVGDAGELLKTGGGKKSPAPHDPGEIFQPPGQ